MHFFSQHVFIKKSTSCTINHNNILLLLFIIFPTLILLFVLLLVVVLSASSITLLSSSSSSLIISASALFAVPKNSLIRNEQRLVNINNKNTRHHSPFAISHRYYDCFIYRQQRDNNYLDFMNHHHRVIKLTKTLHTVTKSSSISSLGSAVATSNRNNNAFIIYTNYYFPKRLKRTKTLSFSSFSSFSKIYLKSNIIIDQTTVNKSKTKKDFQTTTSSLNSNNTERKFSTTKTENLMSNINMNASTTLRFVDIGANLLDERFMNGIYRGTYRHESDIDLVIERAINVGVNKIIITCGTIEESRKAIETVRYLNTKYSSNNNPQIQFYSTVGVHPTRCQQVFVDQTTTNNDNDENDQISIIKKTDDELIQELLDIAYDGMKDQTIIAIGEIGLDYDRLEFSPIDIQKKYFVLQLQTLAKHTNLPLFLHNRNVSSDLFDILSEYHDCWNNGGVVHSFDDTIELANQFIQSFDNIYIGLNGCSLRTKDNLNTVSQIPLQKILLETDCPYCDVRNTHAGFDSITTKFDSKAEKKFEIGKTIKNRQEPCHIIQIAEIVAKCHNVTLQHVSDICYDNSNRLFFSTNSPSTTTKVE